MGKAPDKRSIAVAKNHGLDISKQVCRKFTAQDLEDFDAIFAMDKSNYEDILRLSHSMEQQQKVRLLLSNGNAIEEEVPDPYYGGYDGFEHVYQLINEACNHIAKEL